MVHTEQPTTHHLSPAQTARRILRATGALMLVQIVLRGFGFIEKRILALFFGTGHLADAYNAAREIAMYLFQFCDQVIMHSFLPVFVARIRERGEQDAWRLASTTINLIILLTGTIAVLGIIFTPEILPWFIPGWFAELEHTVADAHTPAFIARIDGLMELIRVTVMLTRVMLVAMVFLTSSSLTYCLLNSYKQFALPASADLALKGIVLVFAVLFVGVWGPLALAAGFVCGAFAKITVHALGLSRRFLNYRPVIDVKHPGLKQFALLALPLLASGAFSIFRQSMDIRYTSALTEGSLSALKYAKTLCDLPVQFFPYAFGIALFPFLADIAVSGDKERLRGMLMSATRMMILIFVPLAVAFVVMRFAIINGLFGGGEFTADSAELTVGPLQIYSAAMLTGALEIIVLQFFFALSDTLRPAIIGIILVPLHVSLSYLGTQQWHLEAMGIALAFFIVRAMKVTVLYIMIRQKLHSLEGARTLAFLGRILVAMVPFVAILWLGTWILPHLLPAPGEITGNGRMQEIMLKLLALVPFLVLGLIGMAGYLYALYLLRVDEVNLLVQRVRGKVARKKTAEPDEAPSLSHSDDSGGSVV